MKIDWYSASSIQYVLFITLFLGAKHFEKMKNAAKIKDPMIHLT